VFASEMTEEAANITEPDVDGLMSDGVVLGGE
jgi:hypothetical protein